MRAIRTNDKKQQSEANYKIYSHSLRTEETRKNILQIISKYPGIKVKDIGIELDSMYNERRGKSFNPHHITTNNKEKDKPHATRQTIHNHLKILLHEKIIEVKEHGYYIIDKDLEKILRKTVLLADMLSVFLESSYLSELSKRDNRNRKKDSKFDTFMHDLCRETINKKFHKSSFRANEIFEKRIFEFSNKVGSFILYIFTECLLLENENFSREKKEKITETLIGVIDMHRILEVFHGIRYTYRHNPKYCYDEDVQEPFEPIRLPVDDIKTKLQNVYPFITKALNDYTKDYD